jgi:hypothetical protein
MIGDFHYNGHKLLEAIRPAPRRWRNTASIPAMSASRRSDTQFADDHRDRDQERQAGAHRRQLGLARPGMVAKLMDENARADPWDARA